MVGRVPWTETGVFDRSTKTYSVERIPRPPEARAVFERTLAQKRKRKERKHRRGRK